MTVDREQIRRDAEAALSAHHLATTAGYEAGNWKGVAQSLAQNLGTLGGYCLALLAELEQAEKTISAQKDILDNEEMNAYAQYQLRVQAESRLAKVPALVEALKLLPAPLYNGNQAMVADIVLERVRKALAEWEQQ